MINIDQLRLCIIRPALKEMDAWSQEAENLLLGTCAQESRLGTYVKQIGGPALGIFQMEPETYEDIVQNFLAFKPELHNKIFGRFGLNELLPVPAETLIYDLKLATQMCRAHYMRFKQPLPQPKYITGLAMYWKKWYNTDQGKGTVEEFNENYRRYVLGDKSE